MTAALFITFAITAIMGFPIWIVLVLSCFAGIFLGGSATPMLVIAQRMFTSVDSFPLLAIPLFMVAGNLMEGGGISRRLINFCNSLLGGFTLELEGVTYDKSVRGALAGLTRQLEERRMA